MVTSSETTRGVLDVPDVVCSYPRPTQCCPGQRTERGKKSVVVTGYVWVTQYSECYAVVSSANYTDDACLLPGAAISKHSRQAGRCLQKYTSHSIN